MNMAKALFCNVNGGRNNVASGYASNVAGGQNHDADGHYTHIGGGVSNTAAGFATAVSGCWHPELHFVLQFTGVVPILFVCFSLSFVFWIVFKQFESPSELFVVARW